MSGVASMTASHQKRTFMLVLPWALMRIHSAVMSKARSPSRYVTRLHVADAAR